MPSLFPDDPETTAAVEAAEAREAFAAKRWKPKAGARDKQGRLFDRADWKPGQQPLFPEDPKQ